MANSLAGVPVEMVQHFRTVQAETKSLFTCKYRERVGRWKNFIVELQESRDVSPVDAMVMLLGALQEQEKESGKDNRVSQMLLISAAVELIDGE